MIKCGNNVLINTDNVLKCEPIRELKEAKNIIYKGQGDTYDYKDLATWEERCAFLKNENKCEIKQDFPNGSLASGGNQLMCKEIS